MGDSAVSSEGGRVGYPGPLSDREAIFIRKRRGLDEHAKLDRDSLLGVGLSGGGIRSATFCLGLFQGLAGPRLLERIDYLSTVSGGGYFGAFYGRLFNRPQVTGHDDVRALLRPDLVQSVPGDRFSRGTVFRFLRENGRYLAPSGAGDLILGGAVILRNWVSVQVVLFTFVLMLLQLPQLLRAAVHVGVGDVRWGEFERLLAAALPLGKTYLWWSPYVVVALAVFVLAVVPLGWAYWATGDRAPGVATPGTRRRRRRIPNYVDPLIGLVVATVLAGVGAWYWSESQGAALVLGSLAVAGCIAIVIQVVYRLAGWSKRQDATRRELSGMLKGALMVFAFLLAFVLIDTLGQTIYVVWHAGFETLNAWFAALLGALAALGAGARRIAVFTSAGRPSMQLPKRVVGWIAAVLLYLIVLTIAGVVSHAMAWQFQVPPHVPPGLPGAGSVGGARSGFDDLCIPTVVLFALIVVSWLFGRSWPFLNRSSLHALYSARLTRAYLGASNACRVDRARASEWDPCKKESANDDRDPVTITDVIEGDNVGLAGYYGFASGLPRQCEPFSKGAPLHIVNVTVNETIDGQSQIQRLDRKGFGLAVGPAGFSAGVRHHAVRENDSAWKVFPEGDPKKTFRVFEGWSNGCAAEELRLGSWSGISGAAFSTGSGSHTHLGLSLLAGFFNVRTGYWWDSGVDPAERLDGDAARGAPGGRALAASFPVQAYLLDEFLSSFHGTGRRWWNLSDGGHFENMGGYELIRRRLPLIIIVDAEADPDYRFEGLSDLVLKARLDFGAEIEFLDRDRLDEMLSKEVAPWFGTLDMLRRGPWREDTVPKIHGAVEPDSPPPAKWRDRHELSASERTRHSIAHAAVARVTFAGDPERCSCLIYVKATLCGGEPADLDHYHAEHPDFPQQTTADQFFDEAQWESYRKLGQLIAERVFAQGLGPFEEMLAKLRAEKTS